MQVAAGARGTICAKPSEAEPFVAAGIDDICIAYSVLGPQKWRRIAAMAAGGVRMTVNCDNETAAGQASEAATAADVTVHLQIDVDSGCTAAASRWPTSVRSTGWPGPTPATTRASCSWGSPTSCAPAASRSAEDQLALSALCTVVSRRTPDLARAADRPVYVETLTEEHGMARAE